MRGTRDPSLAYIASPEFVFCSNELLTSPFSLHQPGQLTSGSKTIKPNLT